MSNTKDKVIRMKLRTYWKLRRAYPALRKESAASYFERLAKYLERVQGEWDGYWGHAE